MAKNNAAIEATLPPQNIDAEKSVLGSLIMDRNAIVKVADILAPEDFYKSQHQNIYEAVLDLFKKGEPIDLLAVASRLKEKGIFESSGGNSYLTELVNFVPTSSHAANYARIVRKKKILRELIESSQEINSMGHEEEEDVDILLDRAEQKIFKIAQRTLSRGFLWVKDALGEAFERIDKLSKHRGEFRGLATGFSGLDNILSGLQKSDLVILASRPSMGKTSLALDIAANIATSQKVPVGLFSLEMSSDQLIDRLISSLANVDLWKLRTGKLSGEGEDNDFFRIQNAMGALSEAPIYVDDTASVNVLQMRAMARRLQAEHGLGLIVVDYLQLMQPTNAMASPVQQVSEISRSLKILARELNVPVLALSQLSRAVEQRIPQIPRLADLRESGCLTGDTLITRADTGERLPIKDLVGVKDIIVHGLDSDLKLKKVGISKIFFSGRKMTYELKTRSGFKIKASANHPFLKIGGWERLDKLAAGDLIATPRKISTCSIKDKMADDEIILIAHLLGDGCVLPRQPIHYTSADMHNINAVAMAAEKLFKINPKMVRQENWWHLYLPSPYRLARGKHHPIINWFHALGIKPVRSYEKVVPQKIFSLSEKQISLFLKHIWATDGNISAKKTKFRKPSASTYYSTTSAILAGQIKHLLLRVGIRSKITEAKKKGYRVCYHVIIQGKDDQLKFLNNIGCFGERGKIIPELIEDLNDIETNCNLDVIPKEIWPKIGALKEGYGLSWRDFAKNYGMSYCGSALFKNGVSRTRLAVITEFIPSIELKNLSESDIFWDEITSITPLKVEDVYDATIPETHNFVANDIIVHNSLEQDADVVLFIYREDRYREDTTRKNIADIIIAKHRNGPIGKVELYFEEQRASFRNLAQGESQNPNSGGGDEYATQ